MMLLLISRTYRPYNLRRRASGLRKTQDFEMERFLSLDRGIDQFITCRYFNLVREADPMRSRSSQDVSYELF